jgi:hypothetical protein
MMTEKVYLIKRSGIAAEAHFIRRSLHNGLVRTSWVCTDGQHSSPTNAFPENYFSIIIQHHCESAHLCVENKKARVRAVSADLA